MKRAKKYLKIDLQRSLEAMGVDTYLEFSYRLCSPNTLRTAVARNKSDKTFVVSYNGSECVTTITRIK